MLINRGVLVMASLMHLKDSLPSLVHSNLASFFNSFCKGFMYSTRFGINLLMKLMCPLKYWRDLKFLGKGIFLMASILSGSILTPSLEMMCPRRFPSSISNTDFAGLREIPYFLHLSKTCLRWLCDLVFLLKKQSIHLGKCL